MIICPSPKLSQTFSFGMSVGKDNKQTLKPCPTDDMLLTPLLVSPPPPPLDGRRLLPLTPTTLLPISTSSRTLPGLCSCRSCFERYLFFWIGFGGNLCFLTSQYSVVALADGGKFRYFFHCFWFKVEALVRLSRIASGGVSFIYIYIYIIFLHHPGLPRPASCSFRILLNCLHLWGSCWFFLCF